MNTSIYLGSNAAHCNFQHSGTLRLFNANSYPTLEKEIQRMFEGVEDIKELYYSIERGWDRSNLHSHLLWNHISSEITGYESIVKYLNPHKVNEGERNMIIRRQIKNSNGFKEQYQTVNFNELIFKNGILYIEKIVDPVNASLYSSKFSSGGINFGYLCR